MENQQVELRFSYTNESFVSSERDYAKAFPRPVMLRLFSLVANTLYILAGINLIGLTALSLLDQIQVSPWTEVISVGLSAVILVDFARRIRNHLKPPHNSFDEDRRWQGERQWILSDEGLQTFNPTSQTYHQWTNLDKIIDAPNSYLFVHGTKNDADWFYLPKYAFTSYEQEKQFKEIVQRHLTLTSVKG
jgi:hypothetical protein